MIACCEDLWNSTNTTGGARSYPIEIMVTNCYDGPDYALILPPEQDAPDDPIFRKALRVAMANELRRTEKARVLGAEAPGESYEPEQSSPVTQKLPIEGTQE